MNGLLIAAHGSRKQPSNEEVMSLTRQIRVLAADVFDRVECGFVQFAEPTVEAQLEKLVSEGVDRIVVFPHFLGSGSHVSNDIPRLVQGIESRHPGVRIRVTPHLGSLDGLQHLIYEKVRNFR
jgi:sirohydrochlorin cobaltochelatase